MKNSTPSILFIGNHANKIRNDIPLETMNDYDLKTVEYQRGLAFKGESSKLILNGTPCIFNGEYELDNLTIALNLSRDHFLNDSVDTLIIGDPFELLFQASIFAILNENPNDVKVKKVMNSVNTISVILLYPAAMEFENLRKEISRVVYILKKHNVKTFLIENHFNQANAIDNILYYYESDNILSLEHQVSGLKQILGQTTTAC
ncbi:MAG: hypothetical protein ACKO6A_07315 [Bacteroidota bacterium]